MTILVIEHEDEAPIGILGGMALSLYLIWFRYGTH